MTECKKQFRRQDKGSTDSNPNKILGLRRTLDPRRVEQPFLMIYHSEGNTENAGFQLQKLALHRQATNSPLPSVTDVHWE